MKELAEARVCEKETDKETLAHLPGREGCLLEDGLSV